MSKRRESVGRLSARTQSSSGPASQKMVSVAVLPPRLPPGMGSPTGVGAADTFDWDESLNWRHNEPINQNKNESASKGKSIMRKVGLTTYRRPIDEDTPPFTLRQVPYETWRKHYAKDKDGNYHGTHAPAEDCLLKPEDVAKWRFGPMRTKADQWTRGVEALPVYAEVKEEGAVPEYEADYTGPPRSEPILDDNGEMKKVGTSTSSVGGDSAYGRTPSDTPAYSEGPAPEITTAKAGKDKKKEKIDKNYQPPSGEIISNGKTAQEIIAEAKAKEKPKRSWKQTFKYGAEIAMMGN